MKGSTFRLPEISRPEFVLWLLRKRKRFKVQGASMYPLLRPGDEVLVDPRAYSRKPPEIGDLVIAQHPTRKELKLVKRVAGLHADGSLDLQGENPFETTDFNGLPANAILGRVTCLFSDGNINTRRNP